MARSPESTARPGAGTLRLISGGAAEARSGAKPAARRSPSTARPTDGARTAAPTARTADGAQRGALREIRSAPTARARRGAAALRRGVGAVRRSAGATRRGVGAMRRRVLRFAPVAAPEEAVSWIGRDFGEPRAQRAPRQRRWPGVLCGLVAAGLLLAGLRMTIVRERYLLGEAIQVETTLRQHERAASVAVRELRDPRRLRRLALQAGFARPERVIELGAAAEGSNGAEEAGLGRLVERREP